MKYEDIPRELKVKMYQRVFSLLEIARNVNKAELAKEFKLDHKLCAQFLNELTAKGLLKKVPLVKNRYNRQTLNYVYSKA